MQEPSSTWALPHGPRARRGPGGEFPSPAVPGTLGPLQWRRGLAFEERLMHVDFCLLPRLLLSRVQMIV